MLEAGEHLAGFAYGDFYATPSPEIHGRNVRRAWHAGKVLFEKWWLAEPGMRKRTLGVAMTTGANLLGIPAAM